MIVVTVMIMGVMAAMTHNKIENVQQPKTTADTRDYKKIEILSVFTSI